ncbi:hypothetical protein L7F22_045868 [Adiantum nelumboides]|nr:hypothetical protein [Adiantum nelumboides]
MPLPKPSKMISKRFKKPRLSNPAISPPPDLLSKNPWPAPPPPPVREWRIRVVCTDPDATDDSSADEAEPSPSPSPARKRLIHELCLPLPSPSPPSTPQSRRGRSPSNRPTRSLSHDLSSSRPLSNSQAEMDTLLDAASAAVSSLYPPSPPSSSSAESADTEEEFTRFLLEFLPEQDGGLWEYDVGQSVSQQESVSLAEMLDLELDTEALSWINSMQRVP